MKIKVSDYIADFLVKNDIRHVFTVTGGGAMHLNDSLGHKKELTCIYNHHEQASAIAAEGYARLSGKLAAVCVTSGPGGTNAITGVLGGWLDSIPMLVLSGQVKRETTVWATDIPLRQLGDQEFNIISSVSSMTKYAVMVVDPNEIRYHLEKALFLALNGRMGPVWLDIPLDVQAARVETESLKAFDPKELDKSENPEYDETLTPIIIDKIKEAKRPVILAGTGIRLAGAVSELKKLAEKLEIPVLTEWNAHDLLESDHPLNAGKPGTVGTRGGNFVIQSCDLLLVLGSRMNIRTISYNYSDFAKNAYKIVVDIDKHELKKPTVKIDIPIWANVRDFIASVLKSDCSDLTGTHSNWNTRCRNINKKYPVVSDEYFTSDSPLNPYAFLSKLFGCLTGEDIVVCGNGSACVMTFQAAEIKCGQRLFTNSGCASMGYGFPAAIGACAANGNNRVVCIDGDGSFQMNIQELQTLVYNGFNLKIFYINNNGYHSIRQTQTNLFSPPLVGVCDGNGVSFPDAEKIAAAYGIRFERIDSLNECTCKINSVLNSKEPVLCEVLVDPKQVFAPKLSSKILPDGTIVSSRFEDLCPFLPGNEVEDVMDYMVNGAKR